MTDESTSLLLSAREASKLCGFGLRTWHTHRSQDRIPAEIRIGGSVRWRQSDLELWVKLGCPSRDTFVKMKERMRGRS